MFPTFDKYFMELMILPSGSNVCIMYKYKPAVSQKDAKVVKMLDISQIKMAIIPLFWDNTRKKLDSAPLSKPQHTKKVIFLLCFYKSLD